MTKRNPLQGVTAGVWVFYVVFLVLIVAEGSVVHFTLRIARWAGISGLGPEIAWLLFAVGGAILGNFELRSTKTAQKMRDPILRLCCWFQRRLGWFGYLLNAGVLGGSPGAAVALKQTNHSNKEPLTYLAAILFASVWVPLFVVVWP